MTKFSESVRVHGSTVTAVSSGESVWLHDDDCRTRRRGPSGRTRLVKVDLRVWSTARDLAEGHIGRIQVISETEVVVHNSNQWRTRV